MRKFYVLIVSVLCCALPLFAQTTEPYNWGSVAMGGGGFVSGIVTNARVYLKLIGACIQPLQRRYLIITTVFNKHDLRFSAI